MTRLRALARRYWHSGNHRTARGELSTSQTNAARERNREQQPSPLEELFHTVALPAVPMPQPVSPAPVNPAALHDWAVV